MSGVTIVLRVPEVFWEGGTISDAFHGTMASNASNICERGFRIGSGLPLEYGDGIYFFEGDYAAALWFAKHNRHERRLRGEVAVVQATVDLGRTFWVNVIGEQIEGVQARLSEVYGEAVSPELVLRLICDELRRLELLDALKVVRMANKPWDDPKRYRAEVVLLVFDPQRIRRPRQVTDEIRRSNRVKMVCEEE